MFKSKYSNLLTIILILTIIAILTVSTILIIKAYNKYKNSKDAELAISKFDDNINNINENIQEESQELKEQELIINNTSNQPNNKGTRKVSYYNNFVMLGYIEIPKIKIKYPILEEETVASLEQSVAIRYPNHPTLNESGNVVIAGHNYRNGMFFSNLKKLSVGDKVKITDSNGRTLSYTIYEIYQTTPEDTSYMSRNVGENIEITLVTCTDDSKARIIVKAKA